MTDTTFTQMVEVIESLSVCMYDAMDIGLEAAWVIAVYAPVATVIGTIQATTIPPPRILPEDDEIGWC